MVNPQELEAQRQRLGLEAETAARVIQQNAVNNPPRWLPALPPGVKFTITSTMIQLLNLKGMFRSVPGDDANQHLMNFGAICKSQEIPGVSQTTMRLRSLNYVTKHVTDAVCGESFMRKPFSESMQLMDEVSKNNMAWYTRDVEVGDLGYTFELSAEQRKREEEKDQDMAHMRTQIDLLTKHTVSKS
uniref:Uncharacterized protein n=1 Tax=Solanum tuberosum TaxID=4113 RepID=M1DWF1_SOLTU